MEEVTERDMINKRERCDEQLEEIREASEKEVIFD
jgi:hypothetical protein